MMVDSELVDVTSEDYYILPNYRVYRDDYTFICDTGIGGLRGFNYVYYSVNGEMNSDTYVIYFPDLDLYYQYSYNKSDYKVKYHHIEDMDGNYIVPAADG